LTVAVRAGGVGVVCCRKVTVCWLSMAGRWKLARCVMLPKWFQSHVDIWRYASSSTSPVRLPSSSVLLVLGIVAVSDEW